MIIIFTARLVCAWISRVAARRDRVPLRGLRIAGLLTLWLTLATPAQADANAASTLELHGLDYVLSDSAAPPDQGWAPGHTWMGWPEGRFDKRGSPVKTVWARMQFDRSQLPAGKLSLLTVENCDRVRVILNGHEIFRNYRGDADQRLGWYRPYLIPLPEGVLRAGRNKILVRIDGVNNLTIGRYWIGTHEAIAGLFDVQMFWHFYGLAMADFTVLLIAFASVAMWLARRKETDLLVLALNGLSWGAFSLFFLSDTPIINSSIHEDIGTVLWYIAIPSTLAYMAFIVDQSRALRYSIFLYACSAPLALGTVMSGPFRYLFISIAEIYYAITSTLIVIAAGVIAVRTPLQRRRMLVLLAVCALCVAGAIHDIGRQWFVNWWPGLGFQLTSFAGFYFCVYFAIVFGQRAVKSFAELERSNLDLEQRVAATRADLARSEALRWEAEVARAVGDERTRIMREVHDGVGSNLVSALAVAEHSNASPAAIHTIRRALVDLRLAVDSLEPVEGEIALLLASFRHRMKANVEDAGWRIDWRIDELPSLGWLDTASALNVLRILQEALSNAIAHSGGAVLTFAAREASHCGKCGIEIALADNGVGIAPANGGSPRGKGLRNMQARANALGGSLSIGPASPGGTRIALWLPLAKAVPG